MHGLIVLTCIAPREPLHISMTTVFMQSNDSEKTESLALRIPVFSVCVTCSEHIDPFLFLFSLFGEPVSNNVPNLRQKQDW